MSDFAHPEALVSTQWVSQHTDNPNVRIVEVDVDTSAYDEGHVPNSIAWNWTSRLCDTIRRDILSRSQFEALMSASGISPDTTVVLYGDNNNWFAAWAVWQMKIYGHKDVRLMDGGRKKWLSEARELTSDVPAFAYASYAACDPDLALRALLPSVRAAVSRGLGDVFYAKADNTSTGRWIARASGTTRGEAERKALEAAQAELLQTRRHKV